jgi:hypothetical protein
LGTTFYIHFSRRETVIYKYSPSLGDPLQKIFIDIVFFLCRWRCADGRWLVAMAQRISTVISYQVGTGACMSYQAMNTLIEACLRMRCSCSVLQLQPAVQVKVVGRKRARCMILVDVYIRFICMQRL